MLDHFIDESLIFALHSAQIAAATSLRSLIAEKR